SQVYLCPFHNQVMSTVQVLILIMVAVFIIVMLATFFFLSMFMILSNVTQGIDGQEVLFSFVIPWT
ncbi:MAG: hypothetical protein WCF07_14075, partial [Nitrososphaeraceae archaeon]